MKEFNKLKACPVCHASRANSSSWARALHAPTGRVCDSVTRREKCFWIKVGRVAFLDWLVGFLCFKYFGLNYFIANNFILFFLPKFMIFFSLQIETWII